MLLVLNAPCCFIESLTLAPFRSLALPSHSKVALLALERTEIFRKKRSLSLIRPPPSLYETHMRHSLRLHR